MKKFILALTVVGALGLSACNTVNGAGDDLKSASKTVENEMDK